VSTTTLTIVIPTHNRSDLLQLCLTSVARFAPPNTEILVVDDASPQAQASVVARRFPGVEVIRLQQRRGFAAAANAGICAANGVIIEILNDDTEVTQGWGEAALDWFKDPAIGSVAPLVLSWPDGRRIDSAGDSYYLGGVASKRGHGQLFGPAFHQPELVFGASASSGFYRREALEKTGLFPESFGSYFEDVDLAFRLQRAGYRAMYEPASRVLHRIGASHGPISRRLLEQQSRNEERVFWRNVPPPVLTRAAFKHAAVLAGKAWRRWQEGRLIPWALGKLQVLREARELRRHREKMNELGEFRESAEWYVDSDWRGHL
jgi:GT2 family glycosyltransferase